MALNTLTGLEILMIVGAVSVPDRVAVTDAELHPLLAQRWSARGFDAAYELGDAEFGALLEAARGEPVYERLVALLAPGRENRV